MKNKIFLNRILHRDAWRILISFKYDAELSNLVRQIKGVQYTNTHKGWYVDDNEDNLKRILLVLKEGADIDISGLIQKPRIKSGADVNIGTESDTTVDKETNHVRYEM